MITYSIPLSIKHFFPESRCTRVWTSGKVDSSGVWTWTATGQPFDYTDWIPGQPDNGYGVEDVVDFWKHGGSIHWNDEGFSAKVCSICEFS